MYANYDEIIHFCWMMCFWIIILVVAMIGFELIRRSLFKKELKKAGYFETRRECLDVLFKTDKVKTKLFKSAKTVHAFEKSMKLDYLVKFFDFQLNDDTLENLEKLYKKTLEAEGIEKSKLFYRGCLKNYLPSFMMYYSSPKGRSHSSYTVTLSSETLVWLQIDAKKVLGKRTGKKIERSKMTNELRDAVLKRDNWTCQNCGRSIFEEPDLKLEVDHIIPISKGGKTEPKNLQTLCKKCNREKRDKLIK